MTVTQIVEPVDFVAIKAGKELTIKAADDLAAEMLIKTYVPEYPDYVTYQEALKLAEKRDEQAADELEASIKAILNAEEDPAEDDLAAEMVDLLLANAELATAEQADCEEREANGPWEEL